MNVCSAQSVGVIVRLERESFQILSMGGKVFSIYFTSVTAWHYVQLFD